MGKEIKTIEDLKKAYPHLIAQLEDDILQRLGIIDDGTSRGQLLNEEKEQVRRKAQHLAGMK
jgi:hypothetical protein